MNAIRRPIVAPLFAATALVFALSHCGEDTAPTTDQDAGTVLACETTEQCPTGQRCEGGICVENTCQSTADCPSGLTCDLLSGQCKGGTGTGTGTSTGTGTGTGTGTATGGTGTGTAGGPCTTKYDCPAGQVCKANKCTAAAANNSCNADQDCPRGKICNFSKQCEDGCVDPKDCDSPKLCHPQKFLCEVCSQSNPCPKDAQGNAQQCIGGTCGKATTCTTTADCARAKDGTVCIQGLCANCTSLADCNVDPYKGNTSTQEPGRICAATGLCTKVTCSDSNCQQALGSPLGYCNTATNQCDKYGCLANSDCSAPLICDTAQHVCSDPAAGGCSGSALTSCQQQCASQNLACNQATCSCGGGTNGQNGASCVADSDCGTGYGCFSGTCQEQAVNASGGACDPIADCLLGALTGGGGCVSAVSQQACDSTACLLGILGGGGGGGTGTPCVTGGSSGGGGACTPGAGQPGDTCTQASDCASCNCSSGLPIPFPGLPMMCQ